MTSKVKPIPDEYRGATPYLCVKDGTRAIEFYKKAFGAREVMRMPAPDGKLGHAEVRIGDAPIMLADEYPEMNFRSPQSIGGTPVNIVVYVNDVDALVETSRGRWREGTEAAGGSVLRRPHGDVGRPVRPFMVLRHAH